jgi:hypothetical protein
MTDHVLAASDGAETANALIARADVVVLVGERCGLRTQEPAPPVVDREPAPALPRQIARNEPAFSAVKMLPLSEWIR